MSPLRAHRRMALIPILVVAWVTSHSQGLGQSFVEATNFPGLWMGPLEWADFDNDGKLDLFATGWDGGWTPRTRIYRNINGGTFAELSGTDLPDVRSANGVVGDYNKDGNVDILVSGEGANDVLSAFRNSGTAQFSRIGGLGPVVAFSVTWGDVDNDGDLDVSVRNYLIVGSPSAFYLNDGNDPANPFTGVADPLPSHFTRSSWCDYDQDGFGDLLATGNPGSGSVRRLFRNNQDESFTDIGIGFVADGSAAWGDFDNDGDPDLLNSGSGGNLIYRNDGGNVFTSVTLGLPGSPIGSAIWGDFNNDGWLDVLVMGSTGAPTQVIRLFHSNGGNSFSDSGLNLPAADGPIRAADFDNDGDLDFAFSGNSTPTAGVTPVFKVFRNQSAAKNSKPNPPAGLTATVTQLSTLLTLSWSPAFDTNQSGGHTYNLRLGTQPGAGDMFNATADTNGFRRVVAAGSCGGRLSRVFTNFPAGQYYWSVQAIDHSYLGSAFAAEGSFVISKPTISDIPDQLLFPDITNSIPFVVNAVGTPVNTLTFRATAADGTLIETNGFAFTGTGTNRTLFITPARNLRGTTTVTVTVTDTNGATASDSFVVVVRHTFTDPGQYFPMNTAWGDYNNDGHLDVLSANSPLRLYRNDGGGTFSDVSASAGLPLNLGGDAAWGDFNNDGYLDLVLTGWTGSARLAEIYRNNGDGTFTNIQAGLPEVSGSVAWGDFDNDGDLDLLLLGTTGLNNYHLLDVWRNDHGTFTAANTGLPIAGFSREPWGDYNRDGFQDLLLGSSVLRNNGNGTFTDIGANIEGIFGGTTSWGDYDGDGYLDVAITGFNGPGPNNRSTKVYHNNGNDTFTDINAGLWPLSYSGLAWGDFDNDGWLDIAITGTTNYTGDAWLPLLVYHNNGDGSFNTNYLAFPGGYGPVQWVDYDRDGALDLVSPWGNIRQQLYHNETPQKNTPPNAPSGLGSAVLNNNDVLLVWSGSLDGETTNSAGLNYNLRVGTTPGGVEIMSPQSDLATGRRRVCARGNASSIEAWMMRDLPRGTYYWGVQAIDPGFVGSPFSAEGSFVITNARPTISIVATQSISHSIWSPVIPFVVEDLETPASALVVTANSSQTNWIPNEQILLGGAGSNRFLQLRPATNQTGNVTVTLTVADASGWTRRASFEVNVINLTPAVAGLSNLHVLPGAPVPTVSFQLGDPESPPEQLSVGVFPSNTNLVADTNVFLGGSGSNRFLQITPTPGMKGTSAIKVVVTDSLGASSTNSFTLRIGDFALVASGLPDVQQGAVDWGDYDNDGRLDVLICGRLPTGTAITRIYHNNGDGTFSDVVAGLPGISSTFPSTASWGDFNGDGLLDFVIAGGGVTRIYRNMGNGSFADFGLTVPSSVAAAWCDYDNDGDLDLVTAAGLDTPNVQVTRIFRNNGNGTFSNSGIALPQSVAIAPADFDNDGDVDLALGGVVINQALMTALIRNEGNGAFLVLTNAGLQGVTSGSWAWADYDQDSRLDLLLTGISGNTFFTRLYHNNTNGTFSVTATNLPGINAGMSIWGDYDNDGRLDIFLAGLTGGRSGGRAARMYRQDNDGTFIDTGEPLTGMQWSSAAFADYNRDGRLDLVYCGTTNGAPNASSTILFRNAVTPTNVPPSAPTSLTVLPGAILSWNPGADAQTTNAGGLTYNLRIGTNAGGGQVMSPHADPVTGQRRVARMGNVGASTRWRANLPPGTYFWSVQAIDTAFAGSPFAAEKSFVIPDAPAVITSAVFVSATEFKITANAAPGLTYRVLTSADLVHWTLAGAATETAAGVYEFVEPTSGGTVRFYRVSSP